MAESKKREEDKGSSCSLFPSLIMCLRGVEEPHCKAKKLLGLVP